MVSNRMNMLLLIIRVAVDSRQDDRVVDEIKEPESFEDGFVLISSASEHDAEEDEDSFVEIKIKVNVLVG